MTRHASRTSQRPSYTGIYPGRADQLHHVRRAVAMHLAGCPAAADATLIVSELAANAIIHSASRGQFFTVRAEVFHGYVQVEAEDLGGPWRRRHADDRPHGLEVIEALTGPDGWGIDTAIGGGRVVWARLDLPSASETARRPAAGHGRERRYDDAGRGRHRDNSSGL